MDFRNYDPAIGRFHSADPLTESAPGWSPYRFAFDNPVAFNDPTGLWEDEEGDGWIIDEEGNLYWDENVTSADDSDLKPGFSYLEYGTNVVDEDGVIYELGENATMTEAIVELDEACMEVENPLDQHSDEAMDLDTWVERNEYKSQEELALEKDKDPFGLPLGPEDRYVINPFDGHVMDMRHVIVVGYGMGEPAGYGAEVIQKGAGALGKDPTGSAFNPQDRYSNNIGARFFEYDAETYGVGMSYDFAIRFQEFLEQAYGQNK